MIDKFDSDRKKALSRDYHGDLENLNIKIQGALDSKIQGGIEKYYKLFITRENLRSREKEKYIQLFKMIDEDLDQQIY